MKDSQGFRDKLNRHLNNCRELDILNRTAGISQDKLNSYRKLYRQSYADIKKHIKNEMQLWMDQNNVGDCYSRVEFYTRDPYGYGKRLEIVLGYVSLFGSKGSIGKSKWLNKITISSYNGYIRSHIARTDERFLGDVLPGLFSKFIVGLQKELTVVAAEVWGKYDSRNN